MDIVLRTRTKASLESMFSLLNVAEELVNSSVGVLENEDVVDQQFLQLVHSAVLEGQFILETLNPTTPQPTPELESQENE